MAEALKDHFGPDVPRQIAEMIDGVELRADESFDAERFVADCLDGYDDLELTPRAAHIADAMATHLPADRQRAIEILVESLGDELDGSDSFGMAPFLYLPHVRFVAEHGHDHFETAMNAQYELTKRFTAEFSIRAYLVGDHRDATLDRLTHWTADPNEHVRRLVSEGTRPRLPWAPRLVEFIHDPTPVVDLLERLRHDESEYVRRSVANNLNDIAKDHPDVVVGIARRWWPDSDGDERRMIRHALRTLVKQGDPAALAVLGYGASSPARITSARIAPERVGIGGKVVIEVDVENPSSDPTGALVDLRVHFVKANGTSSPKVFKGAELDLGARATATVRKTVSVRQHSTRTHHPGTHDVDALLNGTTVEIGSFQLDA